MKCPACGCEFKNPVCVKGGQVKVAKGFSDPKLLRQALKTRRDNKQRRDADEYRN